MRLIQQWLQRYYHIPADFVFNRGPVDARPADAPDLAAELYRRVKAWQIDACDVDRGRVDYDQAQSSRAYADYQACARQLHVFDLTNLTRRDDQLAFWINLYNALLIEAVIQFGVKHSVNEVRGFFWRAAYSIGGRRFTANDIEFGILRANAPHPAWPGAYFTPDDPRRKFSLTHCDPRIHFALNCASVSCPPINFYQSDQIEQQLELAARSFLTGGGVQIDRAAGEVSLSKIFQWYAPDFGASWLALGDRTPLLKFVSLYLANEDDRAYLQHGRPRVRFQRYDWTLNHVTT